MFTYAKKVSRGGTNPKAQAHTPKAASRTDSPPYPHRATVERLLGRSLGSVETLAGPEAREACARYDARALTLGNQVAFAESSPPLAVALHEAIHVVQQAGAHAAKPQALARPSRTDAAETEAHELTDTLLAAYRDGRQPQAPPPIHRGQTQLNAFFWLEGCSPSKRVPNAGDTVGVVDTDSHGWLQVKLGSSVVALPAALKVTFNGRNAGRDEFTVLEGRFAGRAGSVAAKSSSESYFGPVTHSSAASVTFERTAGKVTCGGQTLAAKTDPSNPTPVGLHDVEIPDEPHGLGAGYLGRSTFATTWFRVGTSGDRYLHPGSISAGCVTVTDVEGWTSLYGKLIRSRQSTTAVGTIDVKP